MELFNPTNTSSNNHQFNKRRIYNMQKELSKINKILEKNIINYNQKNLNTKNKLIFINSYNKLNNKNKPSFLDEILEKINIFDSTLKDTSAFYILFEKVKDNFIKRLSFTKIKDKHSIESYNDLIKLKNFSKVISDTADSIDYSLCDSIFKKLSQIKSDMSLFADMLDTKDEVNNDTNTKDEVNNDSDINDSDETDEEDFFM